MGTLTTFRAMVDAHAKALGEEGGPPPFVFAFAYGEVRALAALFEWVDAREALPDPEDLMNQLQSAEESCAAAHKDLSAVISGAAEAEEDRVNLRRQLTEAHELIANLQNAILAKNAALAIISKLPIGAMIEAAVGEAARL